MPLGPCRQLLRERAREKEIAMLRLLPGGPRFASTTFLVLTFTSLALLIAPPLGAQPPRPAMTTVVVDRGVATIDAGTSEAEFHPSRVLVRFRPGRPVDVLPGTPSRRGFPGDPTLYLVENPPGLSVSEVLGRYRANPNVQYAEPDYVLHAVDVTPNDPRWSEQ